MGENKKVFPFKELKTVLKNWLPDGIPDEIYDVILSDIHELLYISQRTDEDRRSATRGDERRGS